MLIIINVLERKIIDVIIVWNFIKKVLPIYLCRILHSRKRMILHEESNEKNNNDDDDEYEVNENDKVLLAFKNALESIKTW